MKFLLIYVPNLRFNGYTENWQKYRTIELGQMQRGKSKHRPRDDEKLYGGAYPFIQTGDIKKANLYIKEYERTYSNYGLSQSKLWSKGTLCITIAANIAETAILGLNACFPDSVIGWISNEKITNNIFIKYYFDFYKTQLKRLSVGGAQENLNLDKLENVYFHIPTLPEQNDITNLLTKIDELIETQIKIINSIESQIRAINNHIASDSTSSELNIASLFHVKTSNKLVESNTGKFCIVDMGTIDANGNYITGKYTDDETSLIPYGTLVMPKDDIGGGKIICKTMCINSSNKYALSDHVFALKLKNDKYNPVYFSALINSQYNNHKLKKLVTGSAQLGINQENLNRYKLKFSDSLELQHKYSEIIVRLNEELIIEKRLLDLFSSQKKYLLKNMFV